MLAPPKISVYAVRGLTWDTFLVTSFSKCSSTDLVQLYVAWVDIEELAPLEFPFDALEGLILPAKKRQLLIRTIESVRRQAQHREISPIVYKLNSSSYITNRLCLLFHGAPGTGKSLAAQCVANFVQRPLLLLTSGMTVDDATFVSVLGHLLKLAKRWDCLVLLEHVDTVMERRSVAELEKTAILTGKLRNAREESLGMLMLGIRK